MSYTEIEELTSLSKNSFTWTIEAVETIWELTRGHPLLAQYLCSKIWQKYSTYISVNEKPIVKNSDINDALSVLTNQFGHIVDYSWDQLNRQEQYAICYLASSPKATNIPDLLNYLEMRALSDFFRNPELSRMLSGLATNDWVESSRDGYTIKIPIFRHRINQTIDLSSLQDILFDDRAQAFSLITQANQTKDDLEAIQYYRQLLAIDPEDDSIRNLLIKKYHSVIEFCLNQNENSLALEHLKSLSQYEKEPAIIQAFDREAEINIRADVLKQKMKWHTREGDFLEGYKLVEELGKHRPGLAWKQFAIILLAHLGHIAFYAFITLILASPGIITVWQLGQFAQVASLQMYRFFLVTFLVFIAVLGGSIKSILNVEIKEALQNHSYESVFLNAAMLYILANRIQDITLDYRIGLAVLILMSMGITIVPIYERSFKVFCTLLIDGVIS